MLAYFMGIGGLAAGFVSGVLYSNYKGRKDREDSH